MKAPDFSLEDQDGTLHSLDEYAGNWLVVYFYPKDDTPGCTKEACGFRDTSKEFAKRGVQVLGVSKDSVASHRKFADKYNLNFPLLSDTDATIAKAYGAYGEKKFMGKTFIGVSRMTFIIDPKGSIAKQYDSVNPLTHAATILSDLQALQSTSFA